MLINGFEGHKTMDSAAAIASMTPGAGLALEAPLKRRLITLSKFEFAGGRAEACSHAIVGHRHDLAANAERGCDFRCDRGEFRALAKTFGAIEMRGKIAIAELKPGIRAEAAKGFKAAEAVAANAPAAFGIGEAGQGVHHRIEIGRDVQAVNFGIVRGVADDEDAFGRQQAGETVEKTRGAYAASDSDYWCATHR